MEEQAVRCQVKVRKEFVDFNSNNSKVTHLLLIKVVVTDMAVVMVRNLERLEGRLEAN
jgi:hypothetical protein